MVTEATPEYIALRDAGRRAIDALGAAHLWSLSPLERAKVYSVNSRREIYEHAIAKWTAWRMGVQFCPGCGSANTMEPMANPPIGAYLDRPWVQCTICKQAVKA